MRKYLSSGAAFSPLKVSRTALAALAAAAAFGPLALTSLVAQGCSKSTATTVGCDPSRCAAGNTCISDGKTTECRLACTAQTGASGCAFNWTCTAVEGADTPFCVQDSIPYANGGKGLWGAPCNPTGGFASNPDCDSAQNFWCYGTSPTDGQSFCTQYQCQTNKDCRGGWYCASINQEPSVQSVKRSVKLTTTVCLPREYGAPCESNVDCPALDNGATPQVCITDATGGAKYCTRGCNADTNCRLDAKCEANAEAGGGDVCVPRAGVCKGDGSICAPCRSDDECPTGLCLKAPFSDERFCSVKSRTPCVLNDAGALIADCPSAPDAGPYKVSCTFDDSDPQIPRDQCFGYVPFGDNGNVGCWTKPR